MVPCWEQFLLFSQGKRENERRLETKEHGWSDQNGRRLTWQNLRSPWHLAKNKWLGSMWMLEQTDDQRCAWGFEFKLPTPWQITSKRWGFKDTSGRKKWITSSSSTRWSCRKVNRKVKSNRFNAAGEKTIWVDRLEILKRLHTGECVISVFVFVDSTF